MATAIAGGLILHNHEVEAIPESYAIAGESVDMRRLANVMEQFVSRLLLAALNSEPQQGTGADIGN